MKQAPLLLIVACISIVGTYFLKPEAAPAQGGPTPPALSSADEYSFVPYSRESKDPIKLMEGPGVLRAVIGQTGKYQLCEGPVENLKPIVSALRLERDGGGERLDINVRVQHGIFLRPFKMNLDRGGNLFGGILSMNADLYSTYGLQQLEPSDAMGFTVIFRRGA